MKKFLMISILVLFFFKVEAQFLQDQNGTAYLVKTYTDISGSPFYSANWNMGMIKLRNGNTYNKAELKYNVFEEILLFKSKSGEQLELVEPVDQFAFQNADGSKTLFRNLPFHKKAKKGNAYFQVLYDGGIPLYKKPSKEILEAKEYGSSITLKKFEDIYTYYTVKDAVLILLKKVDAKQLSSLFPGKTDEINTYLKSKPLSIKDENSLIELFAHLNSI